VVVHDGVALSALSHGEERREVFLHQLLGVVVRDEVPASSRHARGLVGHEEAVVVVAAMQVSKPAHALSLELQIRQDALEQDL